MTLILDRHRSQANYLKRLGQNVGQHMMPRSFPFCSHTLMYWISHLASPAAADEKATSQQRQLGDGYDRLLVALWSFFAQRLIVTAWIEACYVLIASSCAEELQRWGTVTRTVERQMRGRYDHTADIMERDGSPNEEEISESEVLLISEYSGKTSSIDIWSTILR